MREILWKNVFRNFCGFSLMSLTFLVFSRFFYLAIQYALMKHRNSRVAPSDSHRSQLWFSRKFVCRRTRRAFRWWFRWVASFFFFRRCSPCTPNSSQWVLHRQFVTKKKRGERSESEEENENLIKRWREFFFVCGRNKVSNESRVVKSLTCHGSHSRRERLDMVFTW